MGVDSIFGELELKSITFFFNLGTRFHSLDPYSLRKKNKTDCLINVKSKHLISLMALITVQPSVLSTRSYVIILQREE